MAIKEKYVPIKYHYASANHFQNNGYIYPTYINNRNEIKIKKDAEILVKVEHLPQNSHKLLTKICDICECEINDQPYFAIMRGRNTNKNKIDLCKNCSAKDSGKKSGIANESNCVATTHPEIAKLFWNIEDTHKYKYASNKRADFKCTNCGRKVENKIIWNVFKHGVPCICSDGISYPEKFMYSVLTQLNIKFEIHKIFEWSKNINTNDHNLNGTKIYDFYLNDINIIIETFGMQHFKVTFETAGGRTLEIEQENDKLKKSLAEKNQIDCFPIDCRYSNMKFIKKNIEESILNELFDLSKIDWLKCHEFACNSLVIKVCELYLKEIEIYEICKETGFSYCTVINYLKQGKVLGLCNYDPKKALSESCAKNNKKKRKPVIQLSLCGEYINEWESLSLVKKVLGINVSDISKVCKGKRKTASGFKWMYKKDYEKSLKSKTLT